MGASHLFVVQSGGQSQHSRLRIQAEDVGGPVREHAVRDLRILPQIRVFGQNLAHLIAPWRVLRNVEGVNGLFENGRVVVGIAHLEIRPQRDIMEWIL